MIYHEERGTEKNFTAPLTFYDRLYFTIDRDSLQVEMSLIFLPFHSICY